MRFSIPICSAAIVLSFAVGANADEWNKRTFLTFSGPVEVPGATLRAGTYTFELADPDSSRHIIRVSEKDTNKPIALFMTIPTERAEAPSENVVMFAERPAGAPQAVQAWFYPGNRTGEEFVYPRTQAAKIAKANRRPVLATADREDKGTETERMKAMRSSEVGRVNERGEMTNDTSSRSRAAAGQSDRSTSPSSSATSTSADRTAASAQQSTPSTSNDPNAASRTPRRHLPQTASNLALFEMLSGGALALALTIRRVRLAVR
jgi:hypothetical protein